MKAIAHVQATPSPATHPRLAELRKAAQGIETMFVKILAGQLRKDGFTAFFGNGTAGEIYADFMDQAIADSVSKGKGIGFAEKVYRTLEPRVLQRIAAEEELRARAEAGNSKARAKDQHGGTE